mmetsp:Transcript_47722/g.147123  ORF Transcript_47722/g.147123 Transcript_47722/m.147123 type:complete len:424 (+) Transcript_47722:126-1397(+)
MPERWRVTSAPHLRARCWPGWPHAALIGQRLHRGACDRLGLLGADVGLALLLPLLHVVAAALPEVVEGTVADSLALVAWMLSLEVLDAAELEMLAVVDELLYLHHGGLRHAPPVQLLLQDRHVEVPERAAVHLAGGLVRKADDLGAPEAVLALQVPLLAVGVLQIVGVVLVERGGIDLRVQRQLLLPPLERLLHREAALLQEGAQLQPTRVLQVLLGLALLLHHPAHARRERAHHVLLEVRERELVARVIRRGLRSHEQLHAVLLQVSQEAANSRVRQRRRQPGEGDVHEAVQAVLELLCEDQLQGAGRNVRASAVHHDLAGRKQVRGHLEERHLEEVGVEVARLAGVPDFGPRRRDLQIADREAAVSLWLVLPATHAGGREVGLLRLRLQVLEAEHEEPLLLPHEPLAGIPGLAERQPQSEV